MKKSKRLLRNTIVALNVMMVVYIGANRLYAGEVVNQTARTSTVAELAALRDFSKVEIQGDFKVELVQQGEFSIAFEPLSGTPGNFVARQEGDTLFLYGHGNRSTDAAALVKIGMPALRRVEAHDAKELQLSGFSDPVVSVQLDNSRHLVLRNNSVKQWRLMSEAELEVQVDAATLAAGKMSVRGAADIVRLE